MNVGHARPTAAGMGGVAGWASPAMGAAKPDQPSSFFLLPSLLSLLATIACFSLSYYMLYFYYMLKSMD
jgi:hypothetical protein